MEMKGKSFFTALTVVAAGLSAFAAHTDAPPGRYDYTAKVAAAGEAGTAANVVDKSVEEALALADRTYAYVAKALGEKARDAKAVLRGLKTEEKNRLLVKAAELLVSDSKEILQANAMDLTHASENGMSEAMQYVHTIGNLTLSGYNPDYQNFVFPLHIL